MTATTQYTAVAGAWTAIPVTPGALTVQAIDSVGVALHVGSSSTPPATLVGADAAAVRLARLQILQITIKSGDYLFAATESQTGKLVVIQ